MRSPDQVSAMQCPVCRVALAMSDRQGIEIDYCPQCRGVWLDRGELDKIIERSAPQRPASRTPAGSGPAAAAGRLERRSGSRRWARRHGGHYKKRKSWLEDIFD